MTESHDKKLFLLDAFALIYRAYFAFGNNQRYNSQGLNTSAILGFTNTLIDLIKKEKPTHLAVVFDAPAVTNRELEFSDYKANRQEMPEDIRTAIPYIKRIIEGFRIPILLSEGYEADDVIGTLARKAESEGYVTYMMTPDKDFGQLVTPHTFIYKPAKSGNPPEILGIKEVCERFEISHPSQVIDVLGLWGDAVDNIPGIPGIGEKTAKKLVGQYGSVEGVIAHAHELKGKMKENVEQFAEQGLLSKRLATIILDAPVAFEPDQLVMEEPDKAILTDLFAELEFRTLARRVFGEDLQVTVAAVPTGGQFSLFGEEPVSDESRGTTQESTEVVALASITDKPHSYHAVSDAAGREALANRLLASKEFSFDTETTGLDDLSAELVGLSFALVPGEAYWIPVSADYETARQEVSIFKAALESPDILKIAQNIKYDRNILMRYGISVAAPAFDTMLAHYLLQPDMRHGMDILAETYLNYRPVPIEQLIGKKGKNQLTMRDVPTAQITDYAAEDADVTLQLKEIFAPELEKQHLSDLFTEVEMPLTSVLAAMEYEGINLDVPVLKKFSEELGKEIEILDKEITGMAGLTFNLDSPKQLGQILYEVLGIGSNVKKTKTGQYATSEDVLMKMTAEHPIIGKILDYRSLRKLKSTYVDALPELVNPVTGRIHTSYMQAVAATGRLSSNNPNLQNIPIKTARGREIRKAFIPRDAGHVLVAADYSQIELRIIAALSGDKNMIQAFREGADIHTATAARVFGVDPKEVNREMRGKAKAVNFGIIYGQSAFGLSENLNIPRGEAREIITSYFQQYPGIQEYMDKSIEIARQRGYVETILGRKRILKDINSANAVVRGAAERNAINAPIQGSAADIIKVAMIHIHEYLKASSLRSKMLLQVHDELVFDVPIDEVEKLQPIVQDLMSNAVKLEVPLTVEINSGKNWLEAH